MTTHKVLIDGKPIGEVLTQRLEQARVVTEAWQPVQLVPQKPAIAPKALNQADLRRMAYRSVLTILDLALLSVFAGVELHEALRDRRRLAHVRKWTDAGVLGFGVERKRRQLKEEAGEVWWQSFARWEA